MPEVLFQHKASGSSNRRQDNSLRPSVRSDPCRLTLCAATVILKFKNLLQTPCEREYKYFVFRDINSVVGTCECGHEP
jgi:hypothetical protein